MSRKNAVIRKQHIVKIVNTTGNENMGSIFQLFLFGDFRTFDFHRFSWRRFERNGIAVIIQDTALRISRSISQKDFVIRHPKDRRSRQRAAFTIFQIHRFFEFNRIGTRFFRIDAVLMGDFQRMGTRFQIFDFKRSIGRCLATGFSVNDDFRSGGKRVKTD